jgi:hypothetical protein
MTRGILSGAGRTRRRCAAGDAVERLKNGPNASRLQLTNYFKMLRADTKTYGEKSGVA